MIKCRLFCLRKEEGRFVMRWFHLHETEMPGVVVPSFHAPNPREDCNGGGAVWGRGGEGGGVEGSGGALAIRESLDQPWRKEGGSGERGDGGGGRRGKMMKEPEKEYLLKFKTPDANDGVDCELWCTAEELKLLRDNQQVDLILVFLLLFFFTLFPSPFQ